MFECQNIDNTIEAIRNSVGKSVSQLPMYYYSFRKASYYLLDKFYNENDKDGASNITKFRHRFQIKFTENFKTIEEDLKRNRSQNRKEPENLPQDSDILKLTELCQKHLSSITEDSDAIKHYTNLRRSLYTLITLDNSRRGGEVSRICIDQYRQDLKKNWNMPSTSTNHSDFITYVAGKNTSTNVGVSIDSNLMPYIELLMNTAIRKASNIWHTNRYLFAGVSTDDPVLGCAEIKTLCKQAKIENTVTATLVRHYVATKMPEKYELSKAENEIYLEHLGHSQKVHDGFYKSNKVEEEKNVVKKSDH